MISLSSLNPYALYIKIGLAALAVAGLFWLGWHEMSIRADLAAREKEVALQKATAEQNAKELNDYAQLQKDIANAVGNIKVKSNNYIRTIETAPAPAVADGAPVILIAGGVPVGGAVSGMPEFQNRSSSGATPRTSGGFGDQKG